MGSILGGSQTTKTEVPAWLEDAARKNMDRADYISQIGYTPYYGPDVAAMTPNQQASMQNTANAAGAFGMAAPSDVMAGMPQAQDYGGMQAYSSGGLFDDALAELARRRPGQAEALSGMFIDPITGEAPNAPFGIMGNMQPGADPNNPGGGYNGMPDPGSWGQAPNFGDPSKMGNLSHGFGAGPGGAGMGSASGFGGFGGGIGAGMGLLGGGPFGGNSWS